MEYSEVASKTAALVPFDVHLHDKVAIIAKLFELEDIRQSDFTV